MKNMIFVSIFILTIIFFSCDNSNKQLDNINYNIAEIKKDLKTNKYYNPRFQLYQSTIAAKGTFKLDSYNGDVYQLVVNTKNENLWEKLSRSQHYIADTKIVDQRNYELFLSTIAIKFTYLINVNTGATWQLVQDTDSKELFFSLID